MIKNEQISPLIDNLEKKINCLDDGDLEKEMMNLTVTFKE